MALNDSLEQLKNFDINNIDFEKIGVWPPIAKLFVVLVLVVVIFSLTYYLKISDLKMALEASAAKELTLRKTYEVKSFEAANLDAFRAQMEEMKGSFTALLSRLPSKTELPELLEDISARGSESGVIVNKTDIEPDKTAEYYIEVPIKIDVDGGYHDMGGFVSGVAGMPRIVTLHDYTITKKKDSGELHMRISAKTYRYRQEQEP